jgi:hypothetical protein
MNDRSSRKPCISYGQVHRVCRSGGVAPIATVDGKRCAPGRAETRCRNIRPMFSPGRGLWTPRYVLIASARRHVPQLDLLHRSPATVRSIPYLYSVIATATWNDVDPQAQLAAVLARLPSIRPPGDGARIRAALNDLAGSATIACIAAGGQAVRGGHRRGGSGTRVG